MAEYERNIPPKIYHLNDPDGVHELWKDMVEFVLEEERIQAEEFQKITDPDLAPEVFVDLMLASLGNPFKNIYLTLNQKRKLVKLLIPIYRQKGTAPGIINAVRFLTGIQVQIVDPYKNEDDGWEIGVGEIGFNTYVGGSRIFCNMMDWTEAFNNAAWTKNSLSVSADAVAGPSPYGRPADSFNMSAAGAEIYQEVTPTRISGETFTGSVWLRASAPCSITATIYAFDGLPTDLTDTTLNLTTSWQRFEFSHTCFGMQTGDVGFWLHSIPGIPETVYAFGANLVRDDVLQPYVPNDNDATDCQHPGRWIYHFFIESPVTLTDEQREIIGVVADFIKPEHTHCTILDVSDPGVIDHWEVGLSEIGIDTYVHA